jgi:hypothetical protein
MQRMKEKFSKDRDLEKEQVRNLRNKEFNKLDKNIS